MKQIKFEIIKLDNDQIKILGSGFKSGDQAHAFAEQNKFTDYYICQEGSSNDVVDTLMGISILKSLGVEV